MNWRADDWRRGDGKRRQRAVMWGRWAVVVAGVAMGWGCDSGGSGTGGTAGTGGGGGSGGTTTQTPTFDECPLSNELHIASVIIDGAGMVVGPAAASVSGTVSSVGIEAPPSGDCGTGQAWVQIDPGGGEPVWLACFQAPSLVWDFAVGDAVSLEQTVNEHPPASASVRTTLRKAGALMFHAEWAFYEADLALPEGIGAARGDKLCASADACETEGFAMTATLGAESVGVLPGEAGVVSGYKLYLDRWFSQKPSSGCDGGDSFIVLSITRAP
ncbi:MAG: hypothetical protein IPK82_19195 [Polyangiaceae bacterium]|nr:hypothetical protein [Polyangiaceae bacterium]